MQGKEFFALAQKLAQMRTEPALRSAISRAYYAAYHCWITLLSEFGFKFSKDASAHEKLAAYLNNAGIGEIQTVADNLTHLRRQRNFADYDLSSKEFQNHIDCQIHLVRAQSIILQIENYSKEPLRTQLKNGVRAYHAIISPSSSSSQAP
jgi:uncharacterized protein (UPF0332 family)